MTNILSKEKIKRLVEMCLEERKIFHSEADFQHYLAWKIHKEFNENFEIRLEFVIGAKHIDIILIDSDKNKIGIELKYKTKKSLVKIDEEDYNLKSHGAQDIGRYDVIKDIERLEELVTEDKIKLGFVIFLTNDESYMRKVKKNASEFSLEDGREITGKMNWGKNTGDGTKKNREKTLSLNGKYKIDWINGSNISDKNNFRYTIFEIHK